MRRPARPRSARLGVRRRATAPTRARGQAARRGACFPRASRSRAETDLAAAADDQRERMAAVLVLDGRSAHLVSPSASSSARYVGVEKMRRQIPALSVMTPRGATTDIGALRRPSNCPDAVRERNPVHTVDQLAEAVRRVGGASPAPEGVSDVGPGWATAERPPGLDCSRGSGSPACLLLACRPVSRLEELIEAGHEPVVR
jgi:hypothetical protein